MKHKAKAIIKNTRVIILLVALVLAAISIYPNPTADGVAIRSIITNSSANNGGMQSPKPNIAPMQREVITAINNKAIRSLEDYYAAIEGVAPNQTVRVTTNRNAYRLIAREAFDEIETNETELVIINDVEEYTETINGTEVVLNRTVEREVELPKIEVVSMGLEDLGLRVYEAPTTNIRKGLDLQGGTRVLLQPESEISAEDSENLIAVMRERLNVYGLSDLIIRSAGDLSGNQYILVEIAGATEDEVRDLLGRQGKFEAKIGNSSVFRGGNDITYVCKSADCAGIDPLSGCGPYQAGQWVCGYRFSISLSQEAAQRQADTTRGLRVVADEGGQYLSEDLRLILDDSEVDQLRIAASLKGRAETQIQITGSGLGFNEQDAVVNALQDMKRMQTILVTGSLPVKLEIVKVDTISPFLGEEFVKNTLFVGLLAIFMVSLIVFIRYRRLTISVPIVLTTISEVIILLGVASLIGWNLDLAAIAGIIIAVGTGVDHQIVIADETLRGASGKIYNWKDRIKGAFFIIMGAYLTTTFAMIPLISAGAGLLKGFAITTIIGTSIGVFIARPAFAAVVEILLKD